MQVSCCYLVSIYSRNFFWLLSIGYSSINTSGGGVGGLTLTFALSKSPEIQVDVYEAASKFTEIGAGIGMWWQTRQVLKLLGLEEDIVYLLTFHLGKDQSELS